MKPCPLSIEPCQGTACRYYNAGAGLLDLDSCEWWKAHGLSEDEAGFEGPAATAWTRALHSMDQRARTMKAKRAKAK
jgi:hypothetical protein